MQRTKKKHVIFLIFKKKIERKLSIKIKCKRKKKKNSELINEDKKKIVCQKWESNPRPHCGLEHSLACKQGSPTIPGNGIVAALRLVVQTTPLVEHEC